MHFHKLWKKYLQDSPESLLEARLRDIKARYPKWHESGWIEHGQNWLKNEIGPKAVSKYLEWHIKWLEHQFDDEYEEGEMRQMALSHDIGEIAEVQLELLRAFDKYKDRLDSKDIYDYTVPNLQIAVDKLGPSNKEKNQEDRAMAVEQSNLIYPEVGFESVLSRPTDLGITAIRPKTEHASCYFGQSRWKGVSTRWCTAANPKETKNYYDDYTSEGTGLVYVTFERTPKNNPFAKVAIVFDASGRVQEFRDAPDALMSTHDFYAAVALGMSLMDSEDMHYTADISDSYFELPDDKQELAQDVANDIIENAKADFKNEPIDASDSLRGQLQAIDDEFGSRIEHARTEYFVGDDNDLQFQARWLFEYSAAPEYEEYESLSLSKSYGFSIPTPADRIKIDKAQHIQYALKKALQWNSDLVGHQRGVEVFLEGTDHEGRMVVLMVAGRYGDEANDYNEFLYDVEQIDDNYSDFYNLFRRILKKEEVLKEDDYDTFVQSIADAEIENFYTDHSENLEDSDSIRFILTDEIDLGSIPAQRYVYDVINALPLDNPDSGFKLIGVKNAEQDLTYASSNALNIFLAMALGDPVSSPAFNLAVNGKIQLGLRSTESPEVAATRQVPLRATIVANVGRLDNTADATLQAVKAISQKIKEISAKLAEYFQEKVFPRMVDDEPEEQQVNEGVAQQVNDYFQSLQEEKGRSRQRGIYRFYCMIGYTVTVGDFQRGLDDIVTDLRALDNVTIVSVVVGNKKVGDRRYIAGLSIKFIPSTPGAINAPVDVKFRIVRDIKRLKNVQHVFKISADLERLE